MKRHAQQLLQSKAYEYAHAINGNILELQHPIVISIQTSKKFAANMAGLYIFENVNKPILHDITLSAIHNDSDKEIFDSIAHELCHAKQMESGKYDGYIPHDDYFFEILDQILIGSELPATDQEYKKLMRTSD